MIFRVNLVKKKWEIAPFIKEKKNGLRTKKKNKKRNKSLQTERTFQIKAKRCLPYL